MWSTSKLRLERSAAALCCLLMACSSAQGAVSYGLTAGIGRTDNVARTAEAEIDETVAMVGAALDATYQSRRIEAQLATQLNYLDYIDDTFDSELLGNLVAGAELDIISKRFTWMVEDTFGQVATDHLSAVSPGNREDVNYFTTGPDLTVPLGSRSALRAQGRYSDVYFENSDLDTERKFGLVGIERRLSMASYVSLRASSERVEYDKAPTKSGFDRDEAYLDYDLQGARTAIKTNLGAARVSFHDTEHEVDGLLARLFLSRRISESTTVTLGAGREFSDVGQAFRTLVRDERSGIDTPPVQNVPEVFQSTYGSLGWQFARNRTALGLEASFFDEAYEETNEFDRERWRITATARRTLNPRTTAYLSGIFDSEQYQRLELDVETLNALAEIEWRLGRMTYVSLQYRYYERTEWPSDERIGENQIWLRIGVFGGTAPASR